MLPEYRTDPPMEKYIQHHEEHIATPNLAFCASTGRTATMFMASTLASLPRVIALHEGQKVGQSQEPVLPLINLQNRHAWYDEKYAFETAQKMRNTKILSEAAEGSDLLIDLAYYNSPIFSALKKIHPESIGLIVFRGCEDFVRSATIVDGEDKQPAGWPDNKKQLTAREQFIAMGRLKPEEHSEHGKLWQGWSAIQRNIWLWSTINSHLLKLSQTESGCTPVFFETLTEDPSAYWTEVLQALGVFSSSNIRFCVDQSRNKLNSRGKYQIGPLCTWTKSEISLFEKLAAPLEERICDKYK